MLRARALALLAREVEEESGRAEGRAEIGVAVEVVAVAARERQRPGGLVGRRARDVVDDAADGLRPVENLPRPLEHLDALEAVNGRMVVGGVVAVGRVSERDAVFEEQHLGGTRRVQAANADVRPQAEALFIAHVHARHLAQRLARSEGAAQFEHLAFEHVDRAGDALDHFGNSRDAARRDDDRLGEGSRVQSEFDIATRVASNQHLLIREREAAARRAQVVCAGGELLESESSPGVRDGRGLFVPLLPPERHGRALDGRAELIQHAPRQRDAARPSRHAPSAPAQREEHHYPAEHARRPTPSRPYSHELSL